MSLEGNARRGGPARGPLRFAVLQVGARMHYAVPALLKRAGMLRHFYTDAVGNLGLTGALGRVVPQWLRPAPLNRLFGRRIPAEISPDEVTTAQGLTMLDGFFKSLSSNPAWRDAAPEALRQRMIAEDFRGANAFYCLDPADLDLIRAAKRRGMVVVYEQVIAPHVGRIMRQERARFPGFEVQDAESFVEGGIAVDREVWRLADVVLAPSEFVRRGMLELGAQPDNIAIVPYGLPEHWFGALEAKPVPGRVLFVGGVGLRKGNQYLAEAGRILATRGVSVDLRVVGPYDAKQIASAPFVGPTYAGQVPRGQVREEFLRADLFAFPTLAEGFALAHLEAMACGVPVVTTPNCGPAVRDGQDGFVIPPRDAQALADRIELIVSNPALRQLLGKNAKARAAEYSWGAYQDRLLATLEDLKTEQTEHRPARGSALAA